MAKIQALYSRDSTETQRKKGLSVPRQKKWLEEEAKRRKFSNIRHYPDDGYSAKDDNRPSYKRLLSDIENDLINVVIVYKGDRIARNTIGFLGFVDLCNKHDVELISLSEKFDTTTPTGRLTLTILASLAEWERGQTVERVKDVMWSKVKKGDFCGGQPALGLDVKDKHLVHNEKESDIVRQMNDRFEDDPFYRGITVWLNSMGYKTKRGTTFAQSTVKRILTNPIYKGYQSFGKRVGGARTVDRNAPIFKANVEPIISAEQFDRVQYLIKTKKHERRQRKHSIVFILGGLARCECGGNLDSYTMEKKQSGKKYCYYKCHNNTSKGNTVCPGNTRPKDIIEKHVLDYVRQEARLRFEEKEAEEIELRRKQNNPHEHLKRIESSIATLKGKRSRFYDALGDGSFPKAEISKRLDKIALELEDTEIQREALLAEINPVEKEKRAGVLGKVNALNGDIFSLPDSDKKAILKQLVKEIRVSRAGEVEIELYEL